jgi:hypothetical protein
MPWRCFAKCRHLHQVATGALRWPYCPHTLQEIHEGAQIAYVQQLSHVALHVGGHVVGEPLMRGNLPVENAWIRPGPQHLEQFSWRRRKPLQLRPAGWQEFEQPRAPGQRLGDRCVQRELLRPSENEATGCGSLIDLYLEIAEEIRRALCFVDDGAVWEGGQEATRVGGGELAHVQGLQTDIRQAGKGGFT